MTQREFKAAMTRELVRRFLEEKPFVDAVAQKLLQYRSKGGWEFSHYCELLGLFAQEGSEQAFAALWSKYEELHKVLKGKITARAECVRYLRIERKIPRQ